MTVVQPLQEGFSFRWVDRGPVERQGFHAAGAYETKFGSIGISADTYRFSGRVNGNGWEFTETAGVYIPVMFGVSLAASIKSFLDTANDHKVPPEAQLGVIYTRPDQLRFVFQADKRYTLPNQDWNFSVGGDIYYQKFFFFRSGYRFDQSVSYNYWTVGGGMVAPRFEISAQFLRSHEDRDEENAIGFHVQATF